MNSSRNGTKFYRSTTEIAFGAVILVILMIGAFVGNVLTSLVFWRRPRLRTSTNISILFLAVSDVLMAGLVMPFSLTALIKGKWPSSPEACAFNAVFIHSLLGVSLTTMACTAVIRYLCVVKPSLHQHYTKPRIVAVGISVLWLINFILQVLSLFALSGRGTYSPENIFCLYYGRAKAAILNMIVFGGLAGAVLLGLIIFLAYFKVFRFVSHHNHTVASNLQHENPSRIEEAKITKTLVIVVFGFAACWALVLTIYVLNILEQRQYLHFKMPTFVFLFQTICIFLSSLINPFIYAFTNKRFRKEYRELLRSFLPSGTQIAPADLP